MVIPTSARTGTSATQVRRFTRDEYERMAQGIFAPDERVELVLGEILEARE
jgi:hypothetical protein